jgi:polysaccharide biosynthesis protein PslH
VRAAFTLLARNTASLERRVLPTADRVWAASSDDAEWYTERLPIARVDVMPNVLGDAPLLGPPEEEATVMMSGFFAYAPNEDAAMQLVVASRELTQRGVVHQLYLVGRSPGPRIIAATKDLAYVTVTGEVDSVEPWLKRATVFAAPLRAGSGTKFKLLQAMLAGRAVVTTPTGARGLGLEDGRHALVRETWEFADGLAELLADAELRERLVADARLHVLEHFGQATLDQAVAASLEGLAD